MGTDIHLVVEVRAVSGYSRDDRTIRLLKREIEETESPLAIKKLEGYTLREGPWQLAAYPYWWEAEYADVPESEKILEGFVGLHVMVFPDWKQRFAVREELLDLPDWEPGFWRDRNYVVFDILGGGRHREMADRKAMIAEPRGFPPEWLCSQPGTTTIDDVLNFDIGDHSFSWLTMKEIFEADWNHLCSLASYYGDSTALFVQPFLSAYRPWYERFGSSARLVFGFDS